MIRRLSIVFVSGLVFAIVLLSAAWLVGGEELAARMEKDGGHTFVFGTHKDSGPTVSRSFPFVAIDTLTISSPVTLRFVKGDKAEMVVSGPERRMQALRWENGRLWLEKRSGWRSGQLEVTITAPVLPALVMQGASDVELVGLDQPSLSIDSSGAIDLSGKGKVERVMIDSKGAGDIDLSDVVAGDANIHIAGAGDVDIAASGKVDAAIAGAGSVTLHTKPAELTSRISGVGSIEHSYE